MDEVSDPAMSVLAEGFLLKGGLKLYILNKIKDTKILALLIIGQKNTILSGTNNFLNYHLKLFHTKIKADKRIGPHNSDVISLIVASLLGDCYGSRRSVEGTRFVYKQSIVHKEYLFWLYEFFYSRGYCSKLEPRKYTRKIQKVSLIKEYYGYEFNTYTFRSFN
jgi:hypothetical protein